MKYIEFKSLNDIRKRFPNNESCHQYLASRRWNGDVECPYCGSKDVKIKNSTEYRCNSCREVFNAITDTFMDGSKVSLVKWIYATYLILKNEDISPKELCQKLSITPSTTKEMKYKILIALKEDNQKENNMEHFTPEQPIHPLDKYIKEVHNSLVGLTVYEAKMILNNVLNNIDNDSIIIKRK